MLTNKDISGNANEYIEHTFPTKNL